MEFRDVHRLHIKCTYIGSYSNSAHSSEQAQCCAGTQWEYMVLATSIHKQEPGSMNIRKQALPEGLGLVRTSDSIWSNP